MHQKTAHQTVVPGVAPPPAAEGTEGQSTALVVADDEEEEDQAVGASMANGVHEHSDEGESSQPQPQPPPQQPQPQAQPLVPATAAAATMLTVPQWTCKLPAVHWQNNGAGTLTANLPDAYTYTLVPHNNGTLLIANIAPL